jgi:hypothetical protein
MSYPWGGGSNWAARDRERYQRELDQLAHTVLEQEEERLQEAYDGWTAAHAAHGGITVTHMGARCGCGETFNG